MPRLASVRIGACLWLVHGCSEPAPLATDDESSGSTAAVAGSSSEGTTAAVADETGSTSTDGGTSTSDGTSGDDDGADSTSGEPAVTVDGPIRIVYLADEARPGLDELWLRDEADYAAGPVRLSHVLPARAFISPLFPISPDGRWLIYRMINPAPGAEHELWGVDIASASGRGPLRIDESGELVHEYAITSDASALVWLTPSGVYSSALSGAAPGVVASHTPAPTGAGAYDLLAVGVDTDLVAFTADLDGTGVINAFVVSLTGGDPIQRSDLTVPGTEVDGNSVSVLPGGVGLVYQADRDVPEPELFWAAATEGDPIKINDAIVDEQIRTERLAPNGSAMAYWVGYPGTPSTGTVRVAALEITGPTAPIDVHAGLIGDPELGNIAWSSDATHLLYSVWNLDRLEGWVAPIDMGVPGAPTRVTGEVLADGEHLVTHTFTPTGDILYIAGTMVGDELFFVDMSAGEPAAPQRISPDLAPGGGLSGDLRVSSDGAHVLFTGYVDSTDTRDLYRAELSGAFAVERINAGLRDGGEVSLGPLFSLDDAHVLYSAGIPAAMQRELFDVPPGGTGFDGVLPISIGGFVKAFAPLP